MPKICGGGLPRLGFHKAINLVEGLLVPNARCCSPATSELHPARPQAGCRIYLQIFLSLPCGLASSRHPQRPFFGPKESASSQGSLAPSFSPGITVLLGFGNAGWTVICQFDFIYLFSPPPALDEARAAWSVSRPVQAPSRSLATIIKVLGQVRFSAASLIPAPCFGCSRGR